MSVGLLGILGQIANAAKVPISKLTLRMIQNAPMPVRYKKFLQGKTLGEAMIAPSVKAQRAVVPFELKALGVGVGVGGVGVAVPIATVLYKNKAPKTKSGVVLPPRPQKRPKSKVTKPIKRPKKPVDIRTETEKMSDKIKKRVATKKTIEKTLKTINKKKK